MVTISEDRLKEIVADAVASANKSACQCGLSTDSQAEMGHFIGSVRDLGKGNLSIGIEEMRKAVAFINTVRNAGANIGGKVAVVVVLGALTIGGVIFTIGFWEWARRGIGGN